MSGIQGYFSIQKVCVGGGGRVGVSIGEKSGTTVTEKQ